MTCSDVSALLALSLVEGLGRAAIHRILVAAEAAGRPVSAFLGMEMRDVVDLLPPGLQGVAQDVVRCEPVHIERASRLVERVEQAGVQPVARWHGDYPEALKTHLGSSAPPLLFVAGDVGLLDEPMAAVVGAREVSEAGRLLAAECASVLTREGVPVVSGGAPGVDSAAHETVIREGGRTVVVLAQGMLTYRGDGVLHEAVRDGRVVLVSEFSPNQRWESHAAVTRNATISALARLVCVIEPRKVGGSIRTARCALDQGKCVAVYCEDGAGSPAVALRRAGAEDILDADELFSAERLLGLWEGSASRSLGQDELF